MGLASPYLRRLCSVAGAEAGRLPDVAEPLEYFETSFDVQRVREEGLPSPHPTQESQPEFPRAFGCTTLINFPLFVRNTIEPHIIIFIFCFIVTTSVLSVGPGHLYSLCGSKFWQRIWLAMIEKNGLCQGIPWQTVTGHHRHHSTRFPVRLRPPVWRCPQSSPTRVSARSTTPPPEPVPRPLCALPLSPHHTEISAPLCTPRLPVCWVATGSPQTLKRSRQRRPRAESLPSAFPCPRPPAAAPRRNAIERTLTEILNKYRGRPTTPEPCPFG